MDRGSGSHAGLDVMGIGLARDGIVKPSRSTLWARRPRNAGEGNPMPCPRIAVQPRSSLAYGGRVLVSRILH